MFGPVARGEAVPGSDLALLVVTPDGTDRRSALVALRPRPAPPNSDGPADRDQLDLLPDHAVDSRRPDDVPDVSEGEARDATPTAEAVLAAVRRALGARATS